MARQFKDAISTVGGISTSANITTTGNGNHSIGSTSNRFSGIYGANIYAYDANAQHYASLRTTTVGTADTQGVGRLIAGNNVASGTAGNAKGQVLLYGTNTGYTALTPGNDTTSNVTVELPSVGGKLMMCAADADNYWGMLPPTGTTSCWMRSPKSGLIPYEKNSEVSSLGTSSWPWYNVCGKHFAIYDKNGQSYGYTKIITEGTADTQGEARLQLGNSISSGAAKNSYGRIALYGTNTGYTMITPGNNSTSNITITLPSSSGTLARTADLEKYLPLSGGTLTGNVTLERSTENKNTYYVAKRTDTGIGVFMGIGTGGINHGVYSQKLDKWLVYADESKCYLLGNADTATKLKTDRTLTIGATGKSFNGSANVSWSLHDIMKGQGLNYDTACNTLYFNNGGTSHKGRISCYNDGNDYVQIALRTADASDNYIALYPGRLSTKGNIKSGAGYSTAAGGITLNEDKNATYYCLDVHRKCDSGSAEYSTARFGCVNSYGGCAAMETRQDGSTVGYVRALPNGGIQIGSGKKLHIQNSAPTANVATGDVWIDAG